MSCSDKTIRTVSSTFVARKDHDVASFVAKLQAEAPTVPKAKEKLKEALVPLQEVLESIKDHIGFMENTYKTQANVNATYEWNGKRQKKSGYMATFVVTFKVDNMDAVNGIYEDLTSIQEVVVESPIFQLKETEDLHKEARKAAIEEALNTFQEECKDLGVDPDDYVVYKWNIFYDNSKRSQRRSVDPTRVRVGATMEFSDVGEDEASPAIEFEAGKAEVAVRADVSFCER